MLEMNLVVTEWKILGEALKAEDWSLLWPIYYCILGNFTDTVTCLTQILKITSARHIRITKRIAVFVFQGN